MAKTQEGLDKVQVKSSEEVMEAANAAAQVEQAVVATDVSKAASVEDINGTVRVRW